MNNSIEILTKIRQAGGSILVEDGDLRISAPGGLLDDQDRAVLAEHRDQLVELLDQELTALQWVEGLDPSEQDRLVDQAGQEWSEIVDGAEIDSLAERLFRSGGPVHIGVVVKEVLASVGIEVEVEEVVEAEDQQPAPVVCRCGSRSYVDVPIYGGESMRRDCAGCDRFLGFSNWHGTPRKVEPRLDRKQGPGPTK